MAVFRIVGVGPQASEPIEKIVSTALEAQSESIRLRRLCGRYGIVEIWAENRLISANRIDVLAQLEKPPLGAEPPPLLTG